MKMKRALGAISATALAAMWSVPAAAAWTLNLREGVTELSREIYGLHMLILWVCVVIAGAFLGALMEVELARMVAVLFVLAMFALIACLAMLLREVFLAVTERDHLIR